MDRKGDVLRVRQALADRPTDRRPVRGGGERVWRRVLGTVTMVSIPIPMTSQTLRRLTADRLLRALRGGQVMTATELIGLTGLSRTAVHDVCNDLLSRGWIDESEALTTGAGPGRRPRRYSINADAGRVLGVDIGASTVRACVADLLGRPLAESSEFLPDWSVRTGTRQAVVDRVISQALEAAGAREQDILSVGVGVPAAVEHDGRLAHRPDIPGHEAGADVAGAIATGRGWPIQVENDANLAALAEKWEGAAQGADDFIVLLAGERLGAGIFVGGRPVRGHRSGAGELRFFNLIPSIGSTQGIGGQTRILGMRAIDDGTATPALVERVSGRASNVEAEVIFSLARNGDVCCAQIVDTVCDRLAHIIGVLATLLDPELVVIAGAVAAAADLLVPSTRAKLPANMINNPPRITGSSLRHEAVVRGGTRLALDYLDEHLLDELDPRG